MWRRFQNFLLSLETYDVLSPDIQRRYQVKLNLESRPALNHEDWFITFWQALGVDPSITEFAYRQLSEYSGLPFSRIVPGDRLEADLCWTEICWFDWELQLFDDFHQHFDQDISKEFDYTTLVTVDDLILFLNAQHSSVHSSL